ncbi:ACY3A amidohydrolase, partial [Amia calva]|nr:ACY3A amidohydrolase [Amia calva]
MGGVYLVQGGAPCLKRTTFTAQTILSNPRATEARRRYTEADLNRCFTSASLSTPLSADSPYELRRAQELNRALGPKGGPGAVDVICDLHNTTTNMGLCLIGYSTRDWICLHLYRYLQARAITRQAAPSKPEQMPSASVRYLVFEEGEEGSYSLESMAKHGFAMEMGPQPQGVLRADLFFQMKQAVTHTLDYIELFNTGTVFRGGGVEVYRKVCTLDYPRDPHTHQITAAVHPQLQDRDFCLLSPGDPLFLTLAGGETLPYEGETPLYPVFVNEGAYYEKNIAVTLAQKETVLLPPMSVQRE